MTCLHESKIISAVAHFRERRDRWYALSVNVYNSMMRQMSKDHVFKATMVRDQLRRFLIFALESAIMLKDTTGEM